MELVNKLKQVISNPEYKISDVRDVLSIDDKTLNPNDKVINGIAKGIIRCGGECPCDQGDIPTKDKMCPCKALRETNYCKCTLYI